VISKSEGVVATPQANAARVAVKADRSTVQAHLEVVEIVKP
jgi:hypothetical protein